MPGNLGGDVEQTPGLLALGVDHGLGFSRLLGLLGLGARLRVTGLFGFFSATRRLNWLWCRGGAGGFDFHIVLQMVEHEFYEANPYISSSFTRQLWLLTLIL